MFKEKNMKKKVSSVLATLLCISLCACGFAACSKESDSDSVIPSDSDSSASDSSEAVVDNRLTEDEWKEIISGVNDPEKAGGNMTATGLVKASGETDFTVDRIQRYDLEHQAFEYTSFDEGMPTDHFYGNYVDGQVYKYEQSESGEWTKTEWYKADSAYDFFKNAYDGVWLEEFLQIFPDLSYDREINAYVGTLEDGTDIIVSTADGKLVSIELQTETYSDKLVFSDYGTTVIELPDLA